MTDLKGIILDWSLLPTLLIDRCSGTIQRTNVAAREMLLHKQQYSHASYWQRYFRETLKSVAEQRPGPYFGEHAIWSSEQKVGEYNDETYSTIFRRTNFDGKEAYWVSIDWQPVASFDGYGDQQVHFEENDITYELPKIIVERVEGVLYWVGMNHECRQMMGLSNKKVLQEMQMVSSMVVNKAEIERHFGDNGYNCRNTPMMQLKLDDGFILYLQIRVARCARQEGKEVLMLELTDVTELYTHKLREEITADLLDSITVVFMAVDKKWRLTHINKAAEQLYGIKRDVVIGRNAWEVFPKVPESIFYPGYMQCMEEQRPQVIEGLSPTSGRWVRSYAYPTHNGLVVFFTDITERKQLLDAIIEHSDNLDSLINNTQDMIWSVDAGYKLLIANNAYLDLIYKLSGEQLKVGEYSLIDALGEQYVSEKEMQYDRALNGESFTVIKEVHVGEEVRYFETNFNPIKNASGNCTGVSCFSRDITTAKLSLETILHQNDILRDIAWIQSHKVRGPLSTIMGLLSLVDAPVVIRDSLDIIAAIKEKTEELDAIVREITEKTRNM